MEADNHTSSDQIIGVRSSDIPKEPAIYDLNSLIEDVHKRFVAVRNEEFERSYALFATVFPKLHENMKETDKYYANYSGSVLPGLARDKLYIKNASEFDVDIILELPNNGAGVTFHTCCPHTNSYIALAIEDQSLKSVETISKWIDFDFPYINRCAVWEWFKKIFYSSLEPYEEEEIDTKDLKKHEKAAAIRNFKPRRICNINGTQYFIRASGPEDPTGPKANLDLEIQSGGVSVLVHMILNFKFPVDRWPADYYKSLSSIPTEFEEDYWSVKARPIMWGSQGIFDNFISWRVEMGNQERQLMARNNITMVYEILKKLRDVSRMDLITNYEIKSLCMFAAMDAALLAREASHLLTHVAEKFYQALQVHSFPYLLNDFHNLIAETSELYSEPAARNMEPFLDALRTGQYKLVAKYLLTADEYANYKKYLH